MPLTVLIVTLVFAVPALGLGVRRVAPRLRWEQRRRRRHKAEIVDRVIVVGLRGLVLLVLLVTTLVTAVGCVAALRADVRLPHGVVILCGVVVGLSILTLATFGRPRR